MEADLQRYYQVDYRDRWATGPRRLTLRRLWVLIKHLPSDAATPTEVRGEPHWSVEAFLLDNLRMAMTGTKEKPAQPHPSRPNGQNTAAIRAHREHSRAAAMARRRERHRKIADGEIT